VGELLEQTPQELMALKNFGTKSMTEVQSRIYALGLPSKLGPPPAVEPGEAEVPSQAEEDETK
jgi:DNA-directed RNA polymerase alpha subunit